MTFHLKRNINLKYFKRCIVGLTYDYNVFNTVKKEQKRKTAIPIIDDQVTMIKRMLPGHARRVQCLVSVLFPVQVFPPFCGDGLEHDLMRNVVPCLQDVLHDSQGDQTDQAPSTTTKLRC